MIKYILIMRKTRLSGANYATHHQCHGEHIRQYRSFLIQSTFITMCTLRISLGPFATGNTFSYGLNMLNIMCVVLRKHSFRVIPNDSESLENIEDMFPRY